MTDELALYAAGSRAYKMPALDEFLNYTTQEQVDVVEPSENLTGELGVKYSAGRLALTANGFFTELRNITGQGLVLDPTTGEPTWTIQSSPETRSYGLELEASASPLDGLTLLGNGTFLDAEYAECPDTAGGNRPCPTGAEVGTFLTGIPEVLGNLSARYTTSGFTLEGDWHFVGSRFSTFAPEGEERTELPEYSYFNFGASYTLPRGVTISADLLNAFQSKGLEEGNPRLSLIGGRTSDLFLARPILPRRLMVSLRYDF